MKTVLISTYDLGHQPFALASAAPRLQREGALVSCNDIAVEALDREAIAAAGLIAIHLPMHTATRLAMAVLPEIKALNGSAHICFFGLYAPLNADYLFEQGAGSIIGGEFEGAMARLYSDLRAGVEWKHAPLISMDKQVFDVPLRVGLPPLALYATVTPAGDAPRTIGYTEASRGCKHLCRHCPVVPVYGGRFHIVQRDVVLSDIRQLVAAGAQHISFGDPDFFNGIGHALPIVEALHAEHPGLSYDVTIKIEHLLRHADALAHLARTGCISITTAAESVDDAGLEILGKGHTRDDFHRAAALVRQAGICLSPTFIPFTPWATASGYLDLLRDIAALGLVPNVAPVQLAIRLLLPQGSHLLDRSELAPHLRGYDEAALSYRWINPDPAVEALSAEVRRTVEDGEAAGVGRAEIFATLWRQAHAACGLAPAPAPLPDHDSEPAVPLFSEAWYCCAEPTGQQFARV